MLISESAREDPFIIVLSSARSGSNWLIGLLRSSASTQIFGELGKADYFDNDRNARRFISYLGLDSLECTSPHGATRLSQVQQALAKSRRTAQMFGFKAFYYHIQHSPWIRELLLSPGSRVIHLYRDRLFDTFTSLSLARHTSIWHSKAYPEDTMLDFDESAYLRFRNNIRRDFFQWKEELQERKKGWEVLELEYGQIGSSTACKMVSEFIGVDDLRLPKLKKQRSRNTEDYWEAKDVIDQYVDDRLVESSTSTNPRKGRIN